MQFLTVDGLWLLTLRDRSRSLFILISDLYKFNLLANFKRVKYSGLSSVRISTRVRFRTRIRMVFRLWVELGKVRVLFTLCENSMTNKQVDA